jgi:hypothetical protein
MNYILLAASFATMVPASAVHASEWVLDGSTITYFVSHPLHHVDGTSHAAKGKGVCRGKTCDFLIAAPVKTFDSGDSNRDLHMLQVTRGGKFPLIVVKTSLPETLAGATIAADLEVQFAGETTHYLQVPFQRADQGDHSRITGTIPLKISDFRIDPPMLLAVSIKDSVPITVDMSWVKRNP